MVCEEVTLEEEPQKCRRNEEQLEEAAEDAALFVENCPD